MYKRGGWVLFKYFKHKPKTTIGGVLSDMLFQHTHTLDLLINISISV